MCQLYCIINMCQLYCVIKAYLEKQTLNNNIRSKKKKKMLDIKKKETKE